MTGYQRQDRHRRERRLGDGSQPVHGSSGASLRTEAGGEDLPQHQDHRGGVRDLRSAHRPERCPAQTQDSHTDRLLQLLRDQVRIRHHALHGDISLVPVHHVSFNNIIEIGYNEIFFRFWSYHTRSKQKFRFEFNYEDDHHHNFITFISFCFYFLSGGFSPRAHSSSW